MKTLILAVIILLGTHISPVQADSCDGDNHVHNYEKMAEMYFMQMDLNDDGSVDKVEFEKSKLSQMIRSFDVLRPDENGFVHKADFIQAFVKAHSKPKTEV
jgi:uncharacterized UPF0160 family protein